ncbi:hypothetical protein BJX76DRAFT_356715 [Aspergillus varians]
MVNDPILELAFNHVVMPPKLPGEQDSDIENVDKRLLSFLLRATKLMNSFAEDDDISVWHNIEKALRTCGLVNEDRYVNKTALMNVFREFEDQNAVILNVTEQNSSLLIRSVGEDVIFEAFESSPTSEEALASQGAMQWDFPSVAASVKRSVFNNPVLQENLTSFLEKASLETLDEFAAKTLKTGREISETRDTVDPKLITTFLMTLVEVNGQQVYPPILRKRIKDDVVWDNAELPWRRSPFWLTLRVASQRLLCLRMGEEKGHASYKFLMCCVLMELLKDSINQLGVERCAHLRAKLCRRLAKLEDEKMAAVWPPTASVYEKLFVDIAPLCRSTIATATSAIESPWNAFKEECRRKIPPLPLRAHNQELYLTLPSSGTYLQKVLKEARHQRSRPVFVDSTALGPNSRKTTTEFFRDMTLRYSALDEMEMKFESAYLGVPSSKQLCSHICNCLAVEIRGYVEAVGDAYEGNPEQMGSFILNVFERWVRMDKCAAVVHPLLLEYQPFVKPEILDVLLLSRLHDMQRLQAIQQYLHARCIQAKRKISIFADTQDHCFASQYFVDYDKAENEGKLYELHDRIDAASTQARRSKERELQRVNQEYSNRTEKIMQLSCTQKRNPDGSHDIRGCTHCWHVRCRRRLKIQVHEDFLPNDPYQRRIAVFELDPPLTFSTYRSLTWDVMNCLFPKIPSKPDEAPEVLLGSYSQLRVYNINSEAFSLASKKKSYLGTHYNFRRLPTQREKVILPLGPKFSYYDSQSATWATDFLQSSFTLAHHFALNIPKELAFSSLYSTPAFAADGDGPSSYGTIASIVECPSELNVHEYMAHQDLMAGKNRRWISILAEMASSNVNFNLQDTTILFHHLALQAGPRLDHEDLRATHVMFKDVAFCLALAGQIEKHVEAISANWREINYMETMLTLTIRLCTLGSSKASVRANQLLLSIRRITLDWISRLRNETRTTQEADVAERTARYGFMSALLCRRTFAPQAYSDTDLDAESFKSFVEATLSMQESLVVDLSRFSTTTRNMLVRDIKMGHRMKATVRPLAERYPSSLQSAIDTFWPNPSGSPRPYTGWFVLPPPYDFWMTSTVAATASSAPQTVHYHLLEGHLLIDGKPIGKLPAEIRDSTILKNLFGNQRLAAFPSNLPGMSYMLGIPKNEYYIHLGYNGERLIIQAQGRTNLLEFIPNHIFANESSFDLPAFLIDDCVHWLDLKSGNLEIRRQPDIWKSKSSNWTINMHTREGRRRESILVDPHSKTFGLMAQIFRDFLPARLLTVYQPRGNLAVELKTMDLDFSVNMNHRLHCRKLASEVDPDQDVGALYGLRSMIVLRDAANPLQRSVITTLGPLRYRLHGVHVHVKMENDGNYARYMIDDVLGRLHCPPEPRLLYNKAMVHAFTSFLLPDPLTGRTGTEEALRFLQSGSCQPWAPISMSLVPILKAIGNLSPRRHYYPKELKRQQAVTWDPNLTVTIQHDAFKVVIDSILKKLEQLSLFQVDALKVHEEDEAVWTSPHLRERAHWRRSIYERPEIMSVAIPTSSDRKYVSRGTPNQSKRTSNARELLTLLFSRPTLISTTKGLKEILRKWPIIGGYMGEFTPHLITDCLEADLGEQWGGLVMLCQNCKPEDVYNLMFRVGLTAFREKVDMRVLRTAVSFFILDDLKHIDLPRYASFAGSEIDSRITVQDLSSMIRPHCKDYQKAQFRRHSLNSLTFAAGRDAHEKNCTKESTEFAKFLLKQWPAPLPSEVGFDAKYIVLDDALEGITPYWQTTYAGLQLSNHVAEVQKVLDRYFGAKNCYDPEFSIPESKIFGPPPRVNSEAIPHLGKHLFIKPGEKVSRVPFKLPSIAKPKFEAVNERLHYRLMRQLNALTTGVTGVKPDSTREIAELESIICRFQNSECPVKSIYGSDLAKSVDALKKVNKHLTAKSMVDIKIDFEIDQAYTTLERRYQALVNALVVDDARCAWLLEANLWPSMTPISLLEYLRSNSDCSFGRAMKRMVLDYAKAIVKIQHLLRMKDALLKSDEGRFRQEYSNTGHVNWDPSIYPDWLLLEIDSNIQIREDQVTVALEMISPLSGTNSVLQMNMGQGKTSVVTPMVACVLADRKKLTRLLVPKALLSQTAQILQLRLGGILGREVTHIPFSRRTPTTQQHIHEYQDLHEHMMQSAGIMLGIPEHVLSFKLCGLQRVSDCKTTEAHQMVFIQRWMDRVCRDILDECDFTLATRTQLIYPSGAQLAVDGHPHRWKVIETILGMVAHHLRDLAQEFPQSIDVIERAVGEFPVVYFLRPDVENTLIQRIRDDICAGKASILPTQGCTKEERQAIRALISQDMVEPHVINTVSESYPDAPNTRKMVYLLRGLLVHGILLLCLKKRWNVQYGLHPARDPVAVPFHAKGVPSDQAEWGHPDVAILFTCLAFYYEGLNHNQLRESLQAVLKSDDPTTEYDQWTQTSASLPDGLRHWNIINVDDEGQVEEIWRHLRFSTVVINHFLNHTVFPGHAKQFSVKLQASGWDVPLFSVNSQCADKTGNKPGITTGFSGTNDNRRLLPMTIKQHDLPGLSHTNAEVLTYLLQKRNRGYVVLANNYGRRFSELELLSHLRERKTRVLIDAGAFILEMDNRSLAKAWLRVVPEAQGAVYFGSDNKAWVQYRAGKTVPLIATPFADNLDQCLVYLDEAHTRGTDLKLPTEARGALTLGLNQTKDHTVQAAMRMRQLGTTQSITFVAPPEVHQKILDVCNRPSGIIDSTHVVTWLLDQTCTTNKDLQPLYFSQGRDFCRRTQAARTWNQFLSEGKHRDAYMAVLEQTERQGLEELYAPEASINPTGLNTGSFTLSGELTGFEKAIQLQQDQSQHSTSTARSSALEEVEQEREVAFEIEEEREVQRPRRLPALKFPGLHEAIREFAVTGLFAGKEGYHKASRALDVTQLRQRYNIRPSLLLRHLYISQEFLLTVKTPIGKVLDDFTRPVNWVLWSTVSDTALVIIPEEAEILIPFLRKVKIPVVHLLVYAAPVTRKMQMFNRLDFYSIPSLPENWKPPLWLPLELGILGGRLYFEFAEYQYIQKSLRFSKQSRGLCLDEHVDEDEDASQATAENILAFLGEWLSLRRRVQDITQTPMGYICQDWHLRSDHPFFTRRLVDANVSSDDYTFQPNSQPESDGEDADSEDENFALNEEEDEKEDGGLIY